MLLNHNNSETSHVKFISYTGRYPNLCSGNLTLEIDGEIATFGYGFESKDKPKYDKFWSSGGCVSFDEHWIANVDEGSWEIDVNRLPEQFRKYATEIDEKKFNSFMRKIEKGHIVLIDNKTFRRKRI